MLLVTLLGLIALQPLQADARRADVVVPTGDGVQAPTQPFGSSTSTVIRTPRIQPVDVGGATGAIRVRVRHLANVRGQEDNAVHGIGVVTGLGGTGDTANDVRQRLISMLTTQNINISLQDVNSANVALVWVEATLPPGIKPGQKLSARISSLYDAESLVGGILTYTELTDVTGATVYATASGAITTGGFSAEGAGATAQRNHLTVGTVANGATVQRAVPTELVTENGFVYLDLRALNASFENAKRISETVNELYPSAATPRDAGTVAVQVPLDLPESAYVAYISSILERELEPEAMARVVLNERTGVIVMGEGVRITRGAITKGNLTVTIAETPEASQPGPFSQGTTEILPRTGLLIEEEDRGLSIVNGAVTLREVVEVLNVLGVTPRDMIQILQSMAQSGMLHAEIVVQ